jgi:glycosyltransferase involved in cell wall biosynthesis
MKIGFEAKRVFHNKTGLGNYSRDLIRILAIHFPENEYYLYNPKKTESKLFETYKNNVFEKNPRITFFKIFKNYWRQKGIVSDLKKDEISVFHGLSGEIPMGLNHKNIKSVVTIHDLIFIKMPKLYSFWDRKIHTYKFKKAAKNSDLIIAISEQTKKDIINCFGISESKIKVIYQGCHSMFKEKFNENEFQTVNSKFSLPEKFILNVGTIEARKNAFLAVKAIRNIDVKLVIVGKETEYSQEIRNYISENNLEEKVIFLKGLTLKELAILYQLATIFVYPSLYEGFGIPIIEALYSRTPVITSKGGVFPEAGGEHSIYIDSNSVEEMQDSILKLWNDPILRKDITDKGSEFVKKFNDEEIANQYMKIYTDLNSNN